jgi:hypothetical protein
MKSSIYKKLLTLLLILQSSFASDRVTLTTTDGVKYENVKILDNGPDSLILLDKSGAFTLMKKRLTQDSKLVVGYDPDADLQARRKKEEDTKIIEDQRSKAAESVKEETARAADVELAKNRWFSQSEQKKMRADETFVEPKSFSLVDQARQNSVDEETELRKEKLILENELLRKKIAQEELSQLQRSLNEMEKAGSTKN